MGAADAGDWRREFGVSDRSPPYFFAAKEQVTASSPQAYVIRRAFELLQLDGVLCTENSPLIYFKLLDEITPEEVSRLHKKFWNHGSAPVLVVVAKEKIHVYSGMTPPALDQPALVDPQGLVMTLERVSKGLREFLISVESGVFFQEHAKSFNPEQRVDRTLLRNLKDTRDHLDSVTQRNMASFILDALLCRLIFTCYLFDREVILPKYLRELGIPGTHLRDILAIEPVREAKAGLYKLFAKLKEHFNGDLFRDDLAVEERQITNKHIETLGAFFRGTLVASQQKVFWPYDFSAIPIETISAIYEHFLKSDAKKAGAFYTPRFLAEIVLDMAVAPFDTLLGKRFLDPACGSGIFLVGLFNRIAEEWKRANPTARNDRRARELMRLLQTSLFGADINPTACRITAFSLYLAYLDQLTPRDIQELQAKGRALPRLTSLSRDEPEPAASRNTIWCTDFFAPDAALPSGVDLVVGNPPWSGIATEDTEAGRWCADHRKPIPDAQIAAAFVWKAITHVSASGQICFVLPHGLLFNHGGTAVAFQKAWLSQHALRRVLNLADFRHFLFEEALHPALVVSYKGTAPEGPRHRIEYWAPKADWLATQAEVITIAASDRSTLQLGEVLRDLDGPDAPQYWKQRLWGTPRDLRLLDRLSLYPRLRDHVRGARETNSSKPWIIAEGFQPVGPKDDSEQSRQIKLPSRTFVPAKSPGIDLFLLPNDCQALKSSSITVRSRSNKNTDIFRAPHVLITKGFQRIAYVDFDVSFRHAVRGIHGPKEDSAALMFLAAYLRSSLAQYFVFHTSASWGMYRPEVHVEEVLRLPFALPEYHRNPKRAHAIIAKVAETLAGASRRAEENFIIRSAAVEDATAKIEPLIDEYFDVQPIERVLIDDTLATIVSSVQPSPAQMPVPTVKPSSPDQRRTYTAHICEALNGWSRGKSPYYVRGAAAASDSLGVGIVLLEKGNQKSSGFPAIDRDLLGILHRLRTIAHGQSASIDLLRGLMIFDRNQIYLVKPIGQRYWTQTAALNDADEVAGTILMYARQEHA